MTSDRARPPRHCSSRSATIPRAPSAWTPATAPARWRPRPGWSRPTRPQPGRAAVLADLDFALGPGMAGGDRATRPGRCWSRTAAPVLAHVPRRTATRRRSLRRCCRGGRSTAGFARAARRRHAPNSAITNCASATGRSSCRSIAGDPEPVERAAYDASYKGVTDVADALSVAAAGLLSDPLGGAAGMTPNHGDADRRDAVRRRLLPVLDEGRYWPGIAAGFGFMVLDTVDGKLARCTGQSSKWGNIFDHGIDLVHPPFWWWAWAEGLELPTAGPFEPVYEAADRRRDRRSAMSRSG